MKKLTKILLAAGSIGLATAGTAAVATPALADVRLNLNFGTPGYYYYGAPYGYYHYRPYYYQPYYYRPYYRHW